MLFVHEIHRVVGAREKAFEAAFRDEWMPALGEDDDARLLWYLHHAHGSGRSYQVVTVTAVADGAAWERLARRVQSGDLQAWARRTDELRHDVESRLLRALPFSPHDIDLPGVATDVVSRPPTLYMEDTMWPERGQLDAYIEAAGSFYAEMLAQRAERAIVRIEAALATAPGAGRHPEVTLMQRVQNMDGLVGLLTTDLPAEMTQPGTWMHDALRFRKRWRSKLLRTATWSPLPVPA